MGARIARSRVSATIDNGTKVLIHFWHLSWSYLGLLAAFAFLNVSINLHYPQPEMGYRYLLPAIDATVLLMIFALLGLMQRTLPNSFLWGITALLVFVRMLRVGDGFEAKYYSTKFSLYMDLPLLPELFRLYYTTVPHLRFLGVCVAIGLGLLLIFVTVYACLRIAQCVLAQPRVGVSLFAIVGVALILSPFAGTDDVRLGVFSRSILPRLVEEGNMLFRGSRYSADIRANIEHVDASIVSHPNNLAKLGGANVYLFLIESYGQTVLDQPAYARPVGETYARIERGLAARGFRMASGILESPTYGGSSWLAHATLGTGVITNDQFRYRVVRESRPITLASTFHGAGYWTVLAQPATTRPWPEGEFYRFDRKYYAWNFDYQGPRFSWAPMPDQYIVDFIHRTESLQSQRQRFVQFALVSSHAPWNCQPPIIDEESRFRKGLIYNRRKAVTFPTDWSDMSQAGDAYVRSIQYDLEVLRRYVENHVNDDALIMILGDHQPNGDVTGHSDAHGVPIHVLSRNGAFVDPFLARGYVYGMKPDRSRPQRPMANFFPEFVRDFST